MNGVIALSSAATLFIVNKHRAADANNKNNLNAQEANVVSAVAAGALPHAPRPAFKTPHCRTLPHPRCRLRACIALT